MALNLDQVTEFLSHNHQSDIRYSYWAPSIENNVEAKFLAQKNSGKSIFIIVVLAFDACEIIILTHLDFLL